MTKLNRTHRKLRLSDDQCWIYTDWKMKFLSRHENKKNEEIRRVEKLLIILMFGPKNRWICQIMKKNGLDDTFEYFLHQWVLSRGKSWIRATWVSIPMVIDPNEPKQLNDLNNKSGWAFEQMRINHTIIWINDCCGYWICFGRMVMKNSALCQTRVVIIKMPKQGSSVVK